MSEDHTEKTVMPDIVRHLLDTVPVSPLSPGIIDYNQPEWLAEFNRRGERIAELESERDRMRKVAEKLVWLYSDEYSEKRDNGLRIDGFYSHEWLDMILNMAREALKGAGE